MRPPVPRPALFPYTTLFRSGLRIAYERAGNGPPLVLLHGFVGDGREWRRQVDGLSDQFTVVAWDAPGAGASSDPPESFRDRKSTRLNSSHLGISYAVFCLKK